MSSRLQKSSVYITQNTFLNNFKGNPEKQETDLRQQSELQSIKDESAEHTDQDILSSEGLNEDDEEDQESQAAAISKKKTKKVKNTEEQEEEEEPMYIEAVKLGKGKSFGELALI